MSDATLPAPLIDYYAEPKPSGFYYGWICVGVAALAMVATIPGRTMGLGIVTKPLLEDLHLTTASFASINLIGTLIGATFALAAGPIMDRLGARPVLTVITLLLGLVVILMARASGWWDLLVGVTLTRGLGQSALSVVSIALVGRWFERRIGPAMGIYAILVTVGFIIAMPALGVGVKALDGVRAGVAGWRFAWGAMGVILVAGATPLFWFFTRNGPESIGAHLDGRRPAAGPSAPLVGVTLAQALATPAFWALALSAFLFNVVYSGLMLFNQYILDERGYKGLPTTPLAIMVFVGLPTNFFVGWLASRVSMSKLMGVAMFLLGAAMLSLAYVHGRPGVFLYAAVIGLSAGAVTVIFFACWSHLYGRRHIGAIQGAAQAVTVLASAVGPILATAMHDYRHFYFHWFIACSAAAGLLGVFALMVPEPAPVPQTA